MNAMVDVGMLDDGEQEDNQGDDGKRGVRLLAVPFLP
jgi:hypothetical protein